VITTGVVTRDGTKHEVDILVLATGFHADRFLWPIEVTGRGGKKLQDLWGGPGHHQRAVAIIRLLDDDEVAGSGRLLIEKHQRAGGAG
jgi:cation diffusion facilitator CzcD-associated flavoprotein CzcO